MKGALCHQINLKSIVVEKDNGEKCLCIQVQR
jgi:hypothetical protein